MRIHGAGKERCYYVSSHLSDIHTSRGFQKAIALQVNFPELLLANIVE